MIIPDISFWQDAPTTPKLIDFVKMKTLTPAVIIRASQATYADSEFVESWANAKAAGLLRGCYHYMDWTKTGQEQADFFYSVFKNDLPELPPILDYEDYHGIPANHLAHVQDFLSRIEELTGRVPMIYTGPSFWEAYGSIDPYWKRFPLWIANWYELAPKIPAPWTDYVLWQDTPKGDGTAYGVESLQIDLNKYRGTLDDLRAFCNLKPVVIPGTKYITNTAVNVRETPTDAGKIVGILAKGTVVTVDALTDPTGGRLHITIPAGWVWSAFLTKVPVVIPPVLTLEDRVARLEKLHNL
jgi:lysozyme